MPAFVYRPGKPSRNITTPITSPTKSGAIDPAWGDVNTDPYAVPAGADRVLMASSLADAGMWMDQWLDELSAIACDERWLLCRLQDPQFVDNPHRPAAVERAAAMEADIIERVRDVVEAEATADRRWQVLTPDERKSTHADYWWRANAHQTRLIGQAWFHLAPRYRWPPGWKVSRQWLAGLPLCVAMDLRIFKVLEYTPNPRPPSMFDGIRNDPVPDELKDEMLKGLKS